MRQVMLPQTNVTVSRFTFGTASLFTAGDARQRARLLDAAYDSGITHFDTAPYYGFGTAERDLKSLLTNHRNITVTTKVGIYSPGGEAQSTASVFLRKAGGRICARFSRPTIDWSVARARDALSSSLKRLGRERIDLYLLHEPDLELLPSEEWLSWLESERDRVRTFGIAVDAVRLRSFITTNNRLAHFVQTTDSVADREADVLLAIGRSLQITYGYIRAALSKGSVEVPTILAAALGRNSTGSVIVSTRKLERVKMYAEISDAVDKAAATTR